MSGAPAGSAPRDPSGVPLRSDYGAGVYRRRIRVVASDGVATAEVEDDFHHFRATIAHDGARVTRARGDALRVPWTTCPGAVRALARLEGLRLSASLRAGAAHTDPRAQCTHLFDAAALAVAFVAGGGSGARLYAVDVPDRVAGRTRATLAVDGAARLAWDVDGNAIASPSPYAGRALSGGGFGRWAEATLPAERAAEALVLQKAVFIAAGRRYRFDEIARASAFRDAVGAACHTFGPDVEPLATRVYGSVRDFTDEPDALLRDPPEPIPPDALLAHPPRPPVRVLFVCVENANRSQMAEAFARLHGGDRVVACSAGSRPSDRVNPRAVRAMRERGVELDRAAPKSLSDVPDVEYDVVATMGCGDACPLVRARRVEDWAIPDPRELDGDAFRAVRDAIEARVVDLLDRLDVGRPRAQRAVD